MMRSPVAVFAATLVLLFGAAVSEFDGYDGMPRPLGMDQAPTSTYGAKPAVEYNKAPANCIWYGWENGNYPAEGTKNCSSSLWASLSKANPADLSGYMYYVPLDTIYFDPSYNEYLCAIGCFDLSNAPPTGDASIPPLSAPPMGAPPLATSPVDAPPPPPSPGVVTPPPPATLFRPPPPATPMPPSQPPASIATPPSSGSGPSPTSAPPGSSPRTSAPGPSFDQTSAGTVASVSSLLVFSVTLVLSIILLV